MNFAKLAIVATVAGLTATGALASGSKGASTEAGILTCELDDATNFVVISQSTYTCIFNNASDEMPDEIYTAEFGKLGIDLTVTEAETLKWAVVSATGRFDEGLISGEYIGASADAALGGGAGVRVLVGGLDDSFTLQPLSVSGSKGIGVAAGLESMSLEYVGPSA
ncbi:MAG: DUF992 domain-containing protein [Pseudomonadota bacterium]